MELSQESIALRIKQLTSLLFKSTTAAKVNTSSFLISREALLDALILLYDECNNEFLMKDPLIAEFVDKYRGSVLQARELCVSVNDFEIKKIISKGRFAEVAVVQERCTRNVRVLKKLRKSDILNVQEGIYFDNERNLMIAASKNDETKKWIPQLFYSFQNMKYIYYVMEYCPGGNLCTMLEYYKKNVPEPMLRFYLSEMIQAIHCVHRVGYVHRDIKPDNILIANSGHLKLADFGSSAKMLKNGQVNSKLILNIPHYTAPEIFKFHDVSTIKGYGCQCDWWSLGIVLYELITGSVPFTSDDVPKLYLSNNYSRKLQYTKQICVSPEMKNIISGLLQPVEKRLTFEKLTHLDYFKDFDWDSLHERDPPFVPSLSSADDTSYFATFEMQRPTPKVEDFKLQRRFTGRNLPFLGFTYLGNEWSDDSALSTVSYSVFIPSCPVTPGDRRKTEYFDRDTKNNSIQELQRYSTGTTRKSGVTSECSNDSFQSAASVRLENEVNQLHLFYNEKALIIEEKLKHKFHDMYNCLTDEQRKYLLEKEQLVNQLKGNEEKFKSEKEALTSKNTELETKNAALKEEIDKLKKSDKLKKDAMTKLNGDLQKANRELSEKSDKLKEIEEKLLNLSNQQAAKLAMLNKTRTNLRSKSVERDKYQNENLTLKNQLMEANKKITTLNSELEKKGKMKLDLEVKMTATNKDGVEKNFKSTEVKDNTAITELKDRLKQREAEFDKLKNESNQLQNNLKFKCQQLEESVKNLESDYYKLRLDYDSLQESNFETVQQYQEARKELKTLEENSKRRSLKKDTKLEKSWSELNSKETEIKELKLELRQAVNNLRSKQDEVTELKEKLIKTTEELNKLNAYKENIYRENAGEIRHKDEEIKFLKEVSITKERHQKNLEIEIKKLKNELERKEKQTEELSEQLAKMNEDMFANLVSIEELKTTVCEKSSKIAICESEIGNLKNQLHEKLQQISNIRTSLNVSDNEKKHLESKIESLLIEIKESNAIKRKEIENNKIEPNELLKKFESMVKDAIKENLSNKENMKSVDFESMLNSVQRKLSLIGDRSVLTENVVQKSSLESQNVTVLEAQVERLELQLEKAKENAILQREAAAQAKKELASAEKQLSDLKIDLRIAQREASTAEEQLRQMQKSKYAYYSELKKEKETVEKQLQDEQEKLKTCEEELECIKQILDLKDNELNEKESSIKSYVNEIQTLQKKNEELRKEKSKIECEYKEKAVKIKELKLSAEKLSEEIKRKDSTLDKLKQKEDEWKKKFQNLEKTYSSVKETCRLQEETLDKFEKYIQMLEEKVHAITTEKVELQSQYDRTDEDLKSSRKLMNEEKSLKLFAENRVRLLETDLKKKEDELKLLDEEINSKSEIILSLEEKIKELEDYVSTAGDSMERGKQYTESMKKEITSLKQNRTELLTDIHRLKEENAALRKELKEATDDLNDLQQANGELQAALAQSENYHEIRHIKDNTTLYQHSKVIELLLQNKFQDGKQKRTLADKLFRLKGKENLNPKELENLLYLERNKSKGLAEQLYQARIELMMRSESMSKSSSPKPNSEYESCFSRSTSGKNPLTSASAFSDSDMPVNPRIKHNIPHKFETKTCTKPGCKCVVCGQAISFGHKMSNCKECHIWSHVSCTVKIGPTCGLPQAMLQHFAVMNKNTAQSSSSLESSMKSEIEGNIRVLRDKIWEKMIVNIHGKRLLFFDKARSRTEPKTDISFEMVKNIDDGADKIVPALENVSDSEKRCVLRIVYRPSENTEKVLYMLAASEEDKVNWMNILKRYIPGSQKQISFKTSNEPYFKGNIMYEFNKSNMMNVNQIIQLASDLCIVAADEGLFSLKCKENMEGVKFCNPIKIAGVEKIKKMKVLSKLRIVLLICDESAALKITDLRLLVSNAEAAECSSPSVNITEVSNTILSLKDCQLVDASSCNSLIAVATTNYLMVLEWRHNAFDDMKYKRKVVGIKCMLFTRTSLLFCTENEFCRIDLKTFNETKLNSFKCNIESSFKFDEPEAIIKITNEIYLVCDKFNGIFVNAEGERIKSAEIMEWPLTLRKIVYNKPFLCITHDNSVSLVYLPSSTENPEEKFKFSLISFCNPSILGTVKDPVRGIYLKENTSDADKLFFLDPIVFMKKNPKQSWSSISTRSSGETMEEDCIQKILNISDETEISLNSSILDSSSE